MTFVTDPRPYLHLPAGEGAGIGLIVACGVLLTVACLANLAPAVVASRIDPFVRSAGSSAESARR